MGSCGSGCAALFWRPKNHELERERFQRTIKFLEQVPLFKKQLPPAELPLVAQHLQERRWNPGDTILRQGDMGERFFLIQSGELRALTTDDDGVQRERCRLRVGDYWGGHTLTTQRPNVATFVASGKRPLVTLSMAKKDFERLGLKAKLVFPKRPALYRHPTGKGSKAESFPDLQEVNRGEDEQKFILDCIRKNPNLRALLTEVDPEKTKAMVANAERREVEKGTVVAQYGEYGEGFFVVASGSLDVMVNAKDGDGGVRSGEVAVASSTMAERLHRKQSFLQQLHKKRASSAKPQTQSVWVGHAYTEDGMRDTEDGMRDSTASRNGTPLRPPTPMRPRDATPLRSRMPERHSFNEPQDNVMCKMKQKLDRSGSLVDMDAEFDVGDQVAFIMPGEFEEPVGIGVVQSISDGFAEVLVGEHTCRVDMDLVRPLAEPDTIARLHEGDSFGELSLLYNVSTEATVKAHENSVVYLIRRKAFNAAYKHSAPRVEEYVALLDEVHILSPLVEAERWELGRQACGFVEFQPGERVLTQGKQREAKLWYVIHRGHGIMHANEDSTQKARLGRARHFGERSLLRGDLATEVNVDAGPEGMVCLTFEGELIKHIIRDDLSYGEEDCPLSPTNRPFLLDVTKNVTSWISEKNQFHSKASFSFTDVELADLTKVALLGSGGFADVFLAWDRKHDKHYALKRMSMGFIQCQGKEATNIVVWERDLMFKVDSPFIVKLYHTFKDTEYLYFLSEALLGGNLWNLLQQREDIFTEDEPRGSSTAFYVACLINALEHLHQRCIVHRDVKPENVLIDKLGYAKICDMGFARYVLGKTNTKCGTPDFMPPEQIDFPHAHSHSVDWWSLGVLTYELLAGAPPFDDEGILDKTERLLAIRRSQEKEDIHFRHGFPGAPKKFILKLLKKLPDRLGAEGGAPEVRADPWFGRLKFDFDALNRRALPAPFVPERSTQLDLRNEMREVVRESIFVPYQEAKRMYRDSHWTRCF